MNLMLVYYLLWTSVTDKAKIQTEALFINGFYDFQPFTMSNTAITPYLGGGVGISRNKMGTTVIHLMGFLMALLLMAIPLISLPINSRQGL